MHKYYAQRTEVDGISFPSKAEAARYCQLKELERTGAIQDLERQPTFKFACGAKYVADFSYKKDGEKVLEDVKGQETPLFILKRKMLIHEFGVEVVAVKMDAGIADTWIKAYRGRAQREKIEHVA